MNECCLNFLGVSITHPDGVGFARKVMLYMREVLARFQEETGNIYNLEATPAESTSYRFALLDTAEFPDIIVASKFYGRSFRGTLSSGSVASFIYGRDGFSCIYRGEQDFCSSG